MKGSKLNYSQQLRHCLLPLFCLGINSYSWKCQREDSFGARTHLDDSLRPCCRCRTNRIVTKAVTELSSNSSHVWEKLAKETQQQACLWSTVVPCTDQDASYSDELVSFLELRLCYVNQRKARGSCWFQRAPTVHVSAVCGPRTYNLFQGRVTYSRGRGVSSWGRNLFLVYEDATSFDVPRDGRRDIKMCFHYVSFAEASRWEWGAYVITHTWYVKGRTNPATSEVRAGRPCRAVNSSISTGSLKSTTCALSHVAERSVPVTLASCTCTVVSLRMCTRGKMIYT